MKTIINVLVIFCLFVCSALAIPADVRDISNEKYFPYVLKAINESSKEIKASLYYISYFKSSKSVNELIDAFSKAIRRGVDIEIVLDRGFENAGSSDMSKKNIQAFSILRKNGIKVYYDDVKTLSHSKYLIIDKKWVITGSFNWSERSLNDNRESAVAIESADLAKEYLKLFDKIPKFSPEPVAGSVPIPREVIKNNNLAKLMVRNRATFDLDIYLWIQKLSFEQQSKTIVIPMQALVDFYFSWQPVKLKKKQDYIQVFMAKRFSNIKNKYSFIKDYYRDAEKQELVVTLDKQNKGEIESLYLSELYWSDSWYKRLISRDKFCLLYMLDKTESGRVGRFFEQERWEMAEKYGVVHTVFAYGLQDLQRFNLIEKYINYEPGERNPNGYLLNDFYIYADFENKLNALEKKTDPELFKAIMRIADLVDEPHDLEAIKKIRKLGMKYGMKVLTDTINLIKRKSGVSPYRRLNYVLAVIENKGEGK